MKGDERRDQSVRHEDLPPQGGEFFRDFVASARVATQPRRPARAASRILKLEAQIRRTVCSGGSRSRGLERPAGCRTAIVESIGAGVQENAVVKSADSREAVRAGACSQVTTTQQFGRAGLSPALQHSCSHPAVPGKSKFMKQRPRIPVRGKAKAITRLNARSFNASCLIYCLSQHRSRAWVLAGGDPLLHRPVHLVQRRTGHDVAIRASGRSWFGSASRGERAEGLTAAARSDHNQLIN